MEVFIIYDERLFPTPGKSRSWNIAIALKWVMLQHGVLTVSRQRLVKKKNDKNEDTPAATQCCIHTTLGSLQMIRKFDLQNVFNWIQHSKNLWAYHWSSCAVSAVHGSHPFRHDSGVEPFSADIRTIVFSWQRRTLSNLYTQEIALHVCESLQAFVPMASLYCKTVNRQKDQTWPFFCGTSADAPPIVVDTNNLK